MEFWLNKLCIFYCHSILEQSCVVWHSSLSHKNSQDLERTQKTFCKLILRQKYKTYDLALEELNLSFLSERRNFLCQSFANKGIINNTLSDLFPKKRRKHNMELRNNIKFKIKYAKNERFKRSSIIHMQKLLNEEI